MSNSVKKAIQKLFEDASKSKSAMKRLLNPGSDGAGSRVFPSMTAKNDAKYGIRIDKGEPVPRLTGQNATSSADQLQCRQEDAPGSGEDRSSSCRVGGRSRHESGCDGGEFGRPTGTVLEEPQTVISCAFAQCLFLNLNRMIVVHCGSQSIQSRSNIMTSSIGPGCDIHLKGMLWCISDRCSDGETTGLGIRLQ